MLTGLAGGEEVRGAPEERKAVVLNALTAARLRFWGCPKPQGGGGQNAEQKDPEHAVPAPRVQVPGRAQAPRQGWSPARAEKRRALAATAAGVCPRAQASDHCAQPPRGSL